MGVIEHYVHYCQLESDDADDFMSDRHIFVQWFKKSILLSGKLNHRHSYFISWPAMQRDRTRQLLYHYYSIHPLSDFRYYWELFMLGVISLQYLICPLLLLISHKDIHRFIPFVVLLEMIGMVNIVLQFFTGYYEKETRRIIFRTKNRAKRYIRSYFFFDLVANIPFHIMIDDDENLLVRMIFLKVIFNLCTFVHYKLLIKQKTGMSVSYFRFFQTLFTYTFINIWTIGIMGIAIHIDRKMIFSMRLLWKALTKTYALSFGFGYAGIVLHGFEFYVQICIILIGFIMRYMIVAHFILILMSLYTRKGLVQELFYAMIGYSYYKQLPMDILKRIQDYSKFVSHNHYYNDNKVLHDLSDNIKNAIKKSLLKEWFNEDIFRLCSSAFSKSLVKIIKKEIFLAGDTIYQIDDPAEIIYFLKLGTVYLCDIHQKPIRQVREGYFFSDTTMIVDLYKRYSATAIAVEPCVVYKLDRDDFRDSLYFFPEDRVKIYNTLRERSRNNLNI